MLKGGCEKEKQFSFFACRIFNHPVAFVAIFFSSICVQFVLHRVWDKCRKCMTYDCVAKKAEKGLKWVQLLYGGCKAAVAYRTRLFVWWSILQAGSWSSNPRRPTYQRVMTGTSAHMSYKRINSAQKAYMRKQETSPAS